jgi:hypothetical protein
MSSTPRKGRRGNKDDSISKFAANSNMTLLARAPDPTGRYLLHDMFRDKDPNEFMINELLK